MERCDWNLLVLSAARGEPLSPVQLQKSLFLLERNLPPGVLGQDFYQFEPYNYGPFDSNAYADANVLAFRGLARSSQAAQGNWTQYSATPEGIEHARELGAMLPEGVVEYVEKLVRWVRNQSFSSLVREIYRRYPETKINSVFKD